MATLGIKGLTSSRMSSIAFVAFVPSGMKARLSIKVETEILNGEIETFVKTSQNVYVKCKDETMRRAAPFNVMQ